MNDPNAIVEARKAEALAERRILIWLRSINPPKKYSVRALALMTLGRGALIRAIA